MNIQSIVFPTDFSECNRAALAYASTLAAETGALLHIVHVHDPREISTTTGEASYVYESNWQQEHDEARKALGQIQPNVAGVKCERHCVVGRPDEEIVGLATEQGANLIVMASHGRTGLSRLLMGSVAEGVMRKASCPVLVVKQPTETGAGDHPVEGVGSAKGALQ